MPLCLYRALPNDIADKTAKLNHVKKQLNAKKAQLATVNAAIAEKSSDISGLLGQVVRVEIRVENAWLQRLKLNNDKLLSSMVSISTCAPTTCQRAGGAEACEEEESDARAG